MVPTLMEELKATQDKWAALPRLRQAIIDNTHGDLFWIGEILLSVLKEETGYPGKAQGH